MNFVFREDPPDRDDFFALFESTGWNEAYRLDADALAGAIDASWYRVSAYDGDRLVGFGRVISDGRVHALIVDLIVDAGWRRRHLGSLILERLVDRCLEHGIRDVQLFCARDMAPFYEKNGFERRPEDMPGMQYRRPGDRR